VVVVGSVVVVPVVVDPVVVDPVVVDSVVVDSVVVDVDVSAAMVFAHNDAKTKKISMPYFMFAGFGKLCAPQ
jgi:hypothetical protein